MDELEAVVRLGSHPDTRAEDAAMGGRWRRAQREQAVREAEAECASVAAECARLRAHCERADFLVAAKMVSCYAEPQQELFGRERASSYTQKLRSGRE